MFCFILVVIVIFIYLLLQKDNQIPSKYLAATLIAYVFAIFSMILYLAKDSYYYNIVYNYFSLPKAVWKYLMFVDISRKVIIRLMNISSLAVIFLGYHFSISYQKKVMSHKWVGFRILLSVMVVLQLIAYDPDLQYYIYIYTYPSLFTLEQIEFIKNSFHALTVAFNLGVIILSIIQLFLSYRKVHFLNFVRIYLVGEGVCYMLIMMSYMVIFWFSPTWLIKVSKIADYIVYLSVTLSRNQIIYTAYPYYLIITSLLCAFCIYELAKIKTQMKSKEFSITKQIDAADTTTKIFCHYMKNEILSIQSKLEMLEPPQRNNEGIDEVIEHCNYLYERLDTIHRGTKTSKINLVETDMHQFMINCLKHMESNICNCELVVNLDEDVTSAMIDPIYFEQALKNIIENAQDSMDTIPIEQRKITIRLQSISNMIVLSIEDTGVGISKENLTNIFTPLYSSKPITKHWGIGLALTHRIIMAHEGKIEVESHEKIGTKFKISLPDMGKYVL